MRARLIQIDPADNVAIVTEAASKGETVSGLTLLSDIPQGHKVALRDLKKGEAVLRYAVVLGYLLEDVKKGMWINEHMLELPLQPSLDELQFSQPADVILPSLVGLRSKGMKTLTAGTLEREIFLPLPQRSSVSVGWWISW
jgi:galactarate dehydratase